MEAYAPFVLLSIVYTLTRNFDLTICIASILPIPTFKFRVFRIIFAIAVYKVLRRRFLSGFTTEFGLILTLGTIWMACSSGVMTVYPLGETRLQRILLNVILPVAIAYVELRLIRYGSPGETKIVHFHRPLIFLLFWDSSVASFETLALIYGVNSIQFFLNKNRLPTEKPKPETLTLNEIISNFDNRPGLDVKIKNFSPPIILSICFIYWIFSWHNVEKHFFMTITAIGYIVLSWIVSLSNLSILQDNPFYEVEGRVKFYFDHAVFQVEDELENENSIQDDEFTQNQKPYSQKYQNQNRFQYFKAYLSKTPFEEGEIRFCYILWIPPEEIIKVGLPWISKARSLKFVAKKYIDQENEEIIPDLFRGDLSLQYTAREFGNYYNQLKPPKKLEFLETSVIQFRKSGQRTSELYSIEPYLEGEYTKYSNNDGWENESRSTPHAFSHFSYEKSNGKLVIVDMQGSSNPFEYYFTDPTIHSVEELHDDGEGNEYDQLMDGVPYFRRNPGNFGTKGIEKFKNTHRCHHLCEQLKLTKLNKLGRIQRATSSNSLLELLDIPQTRGSSLPKNFSSGLNRVNSLDSYFQFNSTMT